MLATVLLVTGALLVNSFINLSRVEKGYDPANALAFQLVLPPEYATERKAATIEVVIAALESRPEVQHAGFAYSGSCSASKIRRHLHAARAGVRRDAG